MKSLQNRNLLNPTRGLHVFQRRLDALASLCGCSLLSSDGGRLEVLSSSGLRNDRFLLYTLREASEKALEALAFVDS